MSALSVVSLSGFPAGAILWEAQPGQATLTVIVKGTFALAPDEVKMAPDQDPLLEERNWDANVLSSLHWPGDFAPSKRRVDVALVGHAYAPRGIPTTELIARLTVGELVKAVRVTGDRTWTTGPDRAPEPSPPAPFARMPLRYERAALSTDNPIGIDAQAPPTVAMPALPNLERVSTSAGAACFGPISPTWRARRRLLDEAATFWAYGVARDPRTSGPSLGPAPPRFDFAFFNAAPADQQVDLLRPGTTLALENLHPDRPLITTRLPVVRPQVFRVPPPGASKGRVEEIVLRCDSLWIDTDRAVAVLTWRGLTDVEPGDDRVGTLVVAADPQGKKLRWAQVEKRLGENTSPTLRLGADGMLPLEEPEVVAPDLLARRHDAVKGSGVADGEAAPSAPPAVAAHSGVSPRIDEIEDETTDALGGPEDERTTKLRALRRQPLAASTPAASPNEAPPSGSTSAVPASREAAASEASSGDAVTQNAIRPVSSTRAPVATAQRPSGLALRKDLTVERCAEIAATLAQKGVDRAAVLRARLLTEASWALVEQHWKRTLAAEAERGERTVADAFDDAFVRAQERLPQPIDLAAYARLTVGVERGEVGRILAELDLELGSLVRLQRVWERRAAGSPELAATLARAVDEARRAGGT